MHPIVDRVAWISLVLVVTLLIFDGCGSRPTETPVKRRAPSDEHGNFGAAAGTAQRADADRRAAEQAHASAEQAKLEADKMLADAQAARAQTLSDTQAAEQEANAARESASRRVRELGVNHVPASVTDDELLAESIERLKRGNLVYSTPEKIEDRSD